MLMKIFIVIVLFFLELNKKCYVCADRLAFPLLCARLGNEPCECLTKLTVDFVRAAGWSNYEISANFCCECNCFNQYSYPVDHLSGETYVLELSMISLILIIGIQNSSDAVDYTWIMITRQLHHKSPMPFITSAVGKDCLP